MSCEFNKNIDGSLPEKKLVPEKINLGENLTKGVIEKPKRIAVRWTSQERDVVKEFVGIKPTANISQILSEKGVRRTIKAVQHLMAQTQISHYSNDGRYTLAEISRLTNTPLSTLAEWAKMGKIPGAVKLNNTCWRVEWDGKNPITPSWDGKRSLLYWEGYDRNNLPKDCVICGNPLPKTASLCCSRKCRGTRMSSVKQQAVERA